LGGGLRGSICFTCNCQSLSPFSFGLVESGVGGKCVVGESDTSKHLNANDNDDDENDVRYGMAMVDTTARDEER